MWCTWRHPAAVERSVYGGDAATCHLALTTRSVIDAG